MSNTPPVTPPPPVEDMHTTWARERLTSVLSQLRRIVTRAATVLTPETPGGFDDGTTFGVQGFCKFALDDATGVLWFQLFAEPPDAVYWARDQGSFSIKSDPGRAIDPLGFLRGRVLDMVAAAGGGRGSTAPPRDLASSPPLTFPEPSKLPKI
jgi:hypothetical protein